MYIKVGDMKALVELHVESRHWDEVASSPLLLSSSPPLFSLLFSSLLSSLLFSSLLFSPLALLSFLNLYISFVLQAFELVEKHPEFKVNPI